MYEFASRIRYSEVDTKEQLTWLALMDYFQDCSVFHSEKLHIGIDYMVKEHVAWILSSWQVCVSRMPHLAETVTVQTWAYGMKGFYGYRNFSMNDEKGERLAYANSVWVFMDTQTGCPKRIPQIISDTYGFDPQIPMECSERKIRIPEKAETKPGFVVPRYFIDTNRHMNNSRYVEVALEYLPEDFDVGEVRVEYKQAAVQGDIIIPRVTVEETRITSVLAGKDGTVYAVVVFQRGAVQK